MERSCALLQQYADAEIVGGLVEVKDLDIVDKNIDISLSKITSVLGIEIEKSEVISILTRLGFEVEDKNDYLTVSIPSRRLDIKIEEDLIEEVGRIHGMDNIKGKLPVLDVIRGHYNKTRRD